MAGTCTMQDRDSLELRGHTEPVLAIAWDPTAPLRLASAGSDKTVRMWDAKSGRIAHSISLQNEALSIVYSHDAKYIVVSNHDCVTLIDTRKNRVVRRVVNPYEVGGFVLIVVALLQLPTLFFFTDVNLSPGLRRALQHDRVAFCCGRLDLLGFFSSCQLCLIGVNRRLFLLQTCSSSCWPWHVRDPPDRGRKEGKPDHRECAQGAFCVKPSALVDFGV